MRGLGKKQRDPNRTDKLRMTLQRRVILEELRERDTHPTADMLYEKVRQRLPHISLGTIYRNLELLTAVGEIQTLEISGSQKRYDGIPQKHYHIRCIHCGSMDNAPIAPMNQLEDELYGATVYTIMGHRLEFMGLCPECSKNEEVRRLVAENLGATAESPGS